MNATRGETNILGNFAVLALSLQLPLVRETAHLLRVCHLIGVQQHAVSQIDGN